MYENRDNISCEYYQKLNHEKKHVLKPVFCGSTIMKNPHLCSFFVGRKKMTTYI